MNRRTLLTACALAPLVGCSVVRDTVLDQVKRIVADLVDTLISYAPANLQADIQAIRAVIMAGGAGWRDAVRALINIAVTVLQSPVSPLPPGVSALIATILSALSGVVGLAQAATAGPPATLDEAEAAARQLREMRR